MPSFTSSRPSPPTRSTRSSPSSTFSSAISSKPQPENPLSGLCTNSVDQDERGRGSNGMHTTLEPSPWVRRFAPLVTAGGAVLDIACGGGRHLRLFAAAGHPVTGIDRDLSGLADLAGSDLAGMPGIELIQADLEGGRPWPLPSARRFAAVIVTNYLYRPLLSALPDLLEPGGVLIYETFARGNERFGRPSSP